MRSSLATTDSDWQKALYRVSAALAANLALPCGRPIEVLPLQQQCVRFVTTLKEFRWCVYHHSACTSFRKDTLTAHRRVEVDIHSESGERISDRQTSDV